MAKQLRIAVIGKTGNGKSSVANSIIGNNVFKTGLSANRVTKVTSSSRTKKLSSDHVIEVFDTPGLYQEGEDESEIRKEIKKSIVSQGLHAVVFVIKIGRFTQEEQEAVEQMKTLFGTSIFRFTIFAFTCINGLGTQALEGFVNESAPPYLKDVISKSDFRIVGFDNRDKTKDGQSVKKILSLVENISHTNNECLYSSEFFEEAFQEKMKLKKEEQEQKEIKRKLEFEEATAEKESALKKKHEEDRNTIAKRQDQINSEQQQYLQETVEEERLSIDRVNSEVLKEIEEKLKSGTNDLIADMNLRTGVALDTKPDAKGPLPDSTDPQHFKGEDQPTSVECFVEKREETASEMKADVTMSVAGRDVRDTEVHVPVVHAEEDQTRDTKETTLEEPLESRTYDMKREQESYGRPPNELRLGIIGKSGNCKSSTGNTIIGKGILEAGITATTTTKETTKAMLETQTKTREALLNHKREDSEMVGRKDLKDNFEEEIREIKEYNAKKEMTANEDKEIFGKSITDHEQRLIDLSKRFDNERESEQKEHEQEMETQKELYERLFEEQQKQITLGRELHITNEAKIEEKKKKSTLHKFGKWIGVIH